MARNPKSTAVSEITDEFRSSNAAVLTEYRGLTVAQLKTLRRSLGGNATYAVVKNTLTKIAARDAGISGLDDLLVGPSAIAFVKGDPVEAAKGIRDFAKANPKLVIKGAYLDGRVLSAADVNKLADLESREVLLAKMAGAMQASLQQAVSLFAAPLSKAARTIDALRAAAEEDPSIIGGAGAPAAAEVAPEVQAPVSEVAAEVQAPEVEVAAEAPAEAAVSPAEVPAEVAEAPAAASPVEEVPSAPESPVEAVASAAAPATDAALAASSPAPDAALAASSTTTDVAAAAPADAEG